MAVEWGNAADTDENGLFPWFVAIASLLVALTLFLRSTVPAVVEQKELHRVQRQLTVYLQQLRAGVEHQQRRRHDLATNPDAMMLLYDELRRRPPDPLERGHFSRPTAGEPAPR